MLLSIASLAGWAQDIQVELYVVAMCVCLEVSRTYNPV